MKLVIDKNWCKVCGICESFCPTNSIHMNSERIEFDMESCVLCLICRDQCPDMAIRTEVVAGNTDIGALK